MKFNTTKKLSKVGNYPDTYYTLWHKLPSIAKERCTSDELAAILDFGYKQRLFGEITAYKEIKS
jgi:hypothetical protein